MNAKSCSHSSGVKLGPPANDYVRVRCRSLSRIVNKATGVSSRSTYGDIMKRMAGLGLHQATLLHTNYGPKPCWTESDPDSIVEETCQVIYAVDISDGARYSLAVVRTALLDYPVAICRSQSSIRQCSNPSLLQSIMKPNLVPVPSSKRSSTPARNWPASR